MYVNIPKFDRIKLERTKPVARGRTHNEQKKEETRGMYQSLKQGVTAGTKCGSYVDAVIRNIPIHKPEKNTNQGGLYLPRVVIISSPRYTSNRPKMA